MAEYYPLLAKAIGSLPNSTLESRRVVYERARKALIGQLRTLHPPVPDEDIERESVALDRAVERVESELAKGVLPAAPPAPAAPKPSAPSTAPDQTGSQNGLPGQRSTPSPPPLTPRPPIGPKPPAAKPPISKPPISKVPVASIPAAQPSAAKSPAAQPPSLMPPAPKPPLDAPAGGTPGFRPPAPRSPLRPGAGQPPSSRLPAEPDAPAPPPSDRASPVPPPVEASSNETSSADEAIGSAPSAVASSVSDDPKRLKPLQRPIAPQPQAAASPKRRLWVIPVVIAVIAAVVAGAAWTLRDRPETLVKDKPAEQPQSDSGKIAERVDTPPNTSPTTSQSEPQPSKPSKAPDENGNTQPTQPAAPAANPEVPVAHRAALLIEAPDEPNKVKTYLGTVVWKLNNAPQGAADAVGLAVEADIDLPDDKMKAVVMFEKNSDASLPASHTIKVRFIVEPGSSSGSVKQISVPQMRPEASPGGEPLAGVTVPITTNSFLVGLSPGNAEAANTELLRRLQWIDIPMMLDNGKIAKLTFEKSDSGQRDLTEALEAWSKS